MTGSKKEFPVSKLPRRLPRDMTAVVNKKPTRLEVMKEEFHRQMMREKERVIIEKYEQKKKSMPAKIEIRPRPAFNFNDKPSYNYNYFKKPTGIPMKKKPLGGVNKEESPVRKVFADGSENGERKTMADIQAFYKRSFKVNGPRRASLPITEKNLMKRSAGKDRSNLLPPLLKNGNKANVYPKKVLPIPPIAQNKQGQQNKAKSYSAPSGSQKPSNSRVNGDLSSAGSSSPVNDIDSQPDLDGLENLKRKNSLDSDNGNERRDSLGSDTENDTSNDGRRDSLGSNAGSNAANEERQFVGVQIEKIEGLSDFHRWKLDQIRVKEENFYKKALKTRRVSSESDDGLREEIEERLLMKQNELLAELAERQHELDKMQEQRLEKERREAEESEKRADIERERSAKLERETARQEEAKRRIEEKKDADRRAKEEREKRARALAEQEAAEEEESQLQNFIPHPPAAPRTNARRAAPRTYSPQVSYSPPALVDTAEEREEVEGPEVEYYRQAAAEASANNHQPFNLKECRICGRKFAEERLKKHEGACKTANKKRKIFDPVKMRLEGTEARQFHWKAEKRTTPPKSKKNWRKQHDEFRKTIQHAKKLGDIEKKGGDIRQITPLPPAENPDYVQCPHCERKFNSNAAERHIPRCQDIKGKPLKRR